MKLLFDQNLSRNLVPRLADIFPDASHVQFEGMTIATDAAQCHRGLGYALYKKGELSEAISQSN